MKETSKQLLSKNKKLFPFHSGGGCIHFGYETDHEDLIWLINKADLFEPTFDFDNELHPQYEWINEYPEDINDWFFTRYQGGINILDELSPKIDQEIIKFCRC